MLRDRGLCSMIWHYFFTPTQDEPLGVGWSASYEIGLINLKQYLGFGYWCGSWFRLICNKFTVVVGRTYFPSPSPRVAPQAGWLGRLSTRRIAAGGFKLRRGRRWKLDNHEEGGDTDFPRQINAVGGAQMQCPMLVGLAASSRVRWERLKRGGFF